MTAKREIVYDKEFVEKLNDLNVTVKFSTAQAIDGVYGKREWMRYGIANQRDELLIVIEDSPEGAYITFPNEERTFGGYEFDDFFKISKIAKAKVDEWNKIHEQIEKEELSKTEQS